jgi:glyoxylase-like metal-dependent hydrolase (beta-lactamase superfamily II)
VLVDAGTPADWDRLLGGLQTIGRSPADVAAVLLTHAHVDHTGFAERARSEMGARVLVHAADEHAARTGDVGKRDGEITSYLGRREFYRTLWILGRRGATKIIPIAEVSTFADGEQLDVPGRPRVIHAPGHTAGSCALLFESRRVLLTGDVIVTRNPLTGRIGPQIMPGAFNSDSEQALSSLGALETTTADLLLAGHGEPWNGGVADAVRRARIAGVS